MLQHLCIEKYVWNLGSVSLAFTFSILLGIFWLLILLLLQKWRESSTSACKRFEFLLGGYCRDRGWWNWTWRMLTTLKENGFPLYPVKRLYFVLSCPLLQQENYRTNTKEWLYAGQSWTLPYVTAIFFSVSSSGCRLSCLVSLSLCLG